ncbi:hypothetical protein Goarm_022859, partial [Gossypium armourianum]|nr:hypothetical protein [Gossypium armourianum]
FWIAHPTCSSNANLWKVFGLKISIGGRFVGNRCRIVSIKPTPATSIWRPPPLRCLKFNVCGIANKDRAGCGATNDADVADIGTVKVALDVYLALNWKLNDSLFIELGSIVVFSWCANKTMRPWPLQEIFVGIERDNVKVGNVVFLMAKKNGNEMASSLAIA